MLYCAESLQVNAQTLTSLPEFSQLPKELQAFVLSDATASKEKLAVLKEHLSLSSREYMKFADYSINPETLAEQVAEAAMALHAELQHQPAISAV